MKAQAQRRIGALVLTLAAAAVLVGAAQADNPNDRAGVAATQTAVVPDWIDRAVATRALMDNAQSAVVPDWIDRAVAARAFMDNTQTAVVPDWIERAAAVRQASVEKPQGCLAGEWGAVFSVSSMM